MSVRYDLKVEEDIEAAVAVVTEVFGPQGRMLPTGKTVQYNAVIYGPLKTALWYGDVDTKEDRSKINEATKRLGFNLNIVTE